MELLGFFAVVVILFFVFSGPIALIWCGILSSRLSAMKEDRDRLEYLLKQQHERNWLNAQARTPAKPEPRPEAAPSKLPPEPTSPQNVLMAMQIAKEHATGQFRPEEKSSKPTPVEKKPEPPAPKPAFSAVAKPEPVAVPPPPAPVPPPLAAVPSTVEKLTPPPILPPEKPTPPPETQAPTVLPSPKSQTASPRPLDDREFEQAHPAAAARNGDIAWQSVELWIGRKLLGWVAVAAFIVSAALFIIHAVNEGWIGRIPPEIRVLCIAGFGGVFLAAGKYFHRIGWRRFSTMLSSAGVIIVFQAGYASFAYFQLISVQAAGVVMTLIVLGSFLLSWHYGSVLLAVISIVGGLAVPLLLSTGTDRYPEFFTYLVILNLGTVMLLNLLRRPPIGLLAFAGTQAEFWLWYTQYYVEPVPFEKITAVLLFQGAFYAVYLLDTTIAAMVPKTLLNFGAELKNLLAADPHKKGDVTPVPKTGPKPPKIVQPTWDDVVRAVISPIVLFGTAWWILRDEPILGPWLGTFAFILSAWYALLAVLYTQHLARTRVPQIEKLYSAYWTAAPAAATILALSFLAVGIPLQFDAEWLALGWTTVFAGLWYFGHRQRNRTFLVMSILFMSAGAIRLLYDIFLPGFNSEAQGVLTKSPQFGPYDFPSLAAVFVALISSVLVDRLLKKQDREVEREKNFWVGLSGYGFLTLFLSVEAVRFFLFRPTLYEPEMHWASCSLTVLWSVLAILLLETGTIFRSQTLRYTALSALGIVAAKMLLFDFHSRLQFETPIYNPFCPAMIGCSLLLMAATVQARWSSRFDEPEKIGWGSLGIVGVFTLLGILSVECYQYYLRNPIPLPLPLENTDFEQKRLLAVGMLSILWTVYAAISLVIGITFKNRAVRICGFVVLVGTAVKIVALEIFQRPDYSAAFWNPYFLTMLGPGVALMAFAVWTTRVKPLADGTERDCYRSLGVLGLFLFMTIMSIECFFHFKLYPPAFGPQDENAVRFFATASLSVLWTVFGVTLLALGLTFRTFTLRNCAAVVFVAALGKFASLEMLFRPDYATALLNPYALTSLCPIIAALAAAVWTNRVKPVENESERFGFLGLGLFGLLLLWIVLSVECYAYFFQNPFLYLAKDEQARNAVGMASLSIFWTIFAAVLMYFGLSGKSAVLRTFAFIIFIAAMVKLKFDLGFDYGTPFFNPFFLTAIWPLVAVMFFAVWTTRVRPLENESEQKCFLWLGLVGIFLLWSMVLSTEWHNMMMLNPLVRSAYITQEMIHFTAVGSLSVLWSIIAAVLIMVGIGWRSAYLRNFGQLIFAAVTIKIVGVEMFRRPAFETALLNPYFIPIAVASAVMIAFAVFTTRLKPLENERERLGYFSFGVIGILLLWGSLSIECFDYFNIRTDWPDHRFLALASLTVFWTLLAVLLAALAAHTGSRPLRILAVLLIAMAFVKVLPYELWERPGYLTPFLNPYATPLGLLAFAMIFVCVLLLSRIGETDESGLKTEKAVYRYTAFTGVVLLWTVMSLECFKAVRILQNAESEAWKAQMALSILWSVFAGVLIFVGFLGRSPVLRWMAILLFAVTLTKVMIVDMAGVHQMYRFGAVFVLAVVLSLAAWAYQRFRPEKP